MKGITPLMRGWFSSSRVPSEPLLNNKQRPQWTACSYLITKEVIMAQAVSTSITRRSVVAGLALTAAPVAVLAGADNAYAQAKQTA